MCTHLLKGSTLQFFEKEMQDCEKREGYVFYVLQRMSCTYLSSDLCLLLKIHLYEIDFSFLVKKLKSRNVYHLLEQYNLYIISFSISLSSNKVSKEKVTEIEERKQSHYIDFESISSIDLILMYLHNIPGPISNFIYHQLNVKHQSPTLSILYHHISTIHDALDTFDYKKCRKTKKRKKKE